MAKDKTEKSKENAKLLAEQNRLLKEQLELEKKIATKLNDRNRVHKANYDLLLAELESIKDSNDLRALTEKQEESIKDQLKGLMAAHSDILAAYGSEAEILANIDEVYAQINNKSKKHNEYTSTSDNFWESIAGHMHMGTNFIDKFVSKSTEMAEEMKDNDGYAKSFANSFLKTFSVTKLITNVLATMITSTATIAKQADEIASSFAAATGFGDKYKGEIIAAGQAHRDLGVGIKQSGESYKALLTGTTNFVNISASARGEIASQSAQLKRLGVDLGTQAGMLQFFNLNLGMTQQESMNATKRIAMMGTQMGITADKMSKDFTASMKTLAVYGHGAEDVFQGLAVAAKNAGVEVGTLLGLAAKFDTFSGAAETTAKLNAMLGTQLSASNMLLATEDERLETLINTIQANGTAFKDMDRFTKKAVAAAAGITDMNEAQKIFGMNMNQYKAHKSKMDATALSQQKIREAVEATIPLQEMLTIAFSEFAVAIEPVLKGMRFILKNTIKFLEIIPEEIKMFIGMAASLFLVAKVIGPMFGLLKGLSVGLGLVGASAPAAAGGATLLGKGFGSFLSAIASPKALLGLAAIVIAISAVTTAMALYLSMKSELAEQEAMEEEAIARQVEAYSKLGGAAADVAALRSELDGLKDIDVDAKATLTNLAFIAAGKAAEAGTASIIDGRSFDIENKLENIFKPTIEITIDGDAFEKLVTDQFLTLHTEG